MKPRALDLFCGAGGVARGLQLAGFHVTGVDIRPQPRYVGDEFHQADAMTFPLEGFDFIWASPPCQAYTVSRSRPKQRKDHPRLVEPMRQRLLAVSVPWAMENVPGSPLRFAVELCGGFFGLGATGDDGVFRSLRRHRLFETSHLVLGPGCHCRRGEKIGVYGNGGGWANRFDPDRKGYKGCVRESRQALGIDWMTIAELSQAIPPAYSKYIGDQLMPHVRRRMNLPCEQQMA